MKTEIEVKFVNIIHDDIRQNLLNIGANCIVPMRDMKRAAINSPEMRAKKGFVRVRDQGDKVTITYKQIEALSLTGAKEIELEVDDFDNAVAIFKAVGLSDCSLQESRRETWMVGDVEVALDEWPWLNPYIEIEGPDEDIVKQIASKLSLDWNDAVFGDVMTAYRIQYPHLREDQMISDLAEVSFGLPLPDMLKQVK
ncbi:MAG: class IV adenylate cyclase [Candidatus Saccharibacteria bacterium]